MNRDHARQFYVLESQPSFYLPGRDCPTRSKAEDGERKS